MTVYDRWHKSHPRPDDVPCKCARGKNKLYPTSEHLRGDRWQVRWYDLDGRQRKRNFAAREGSNPDLHADAFDAKITAELNAGTYIDPSAGEITLKTYAEDWRKNRGKLDANEAAALERRLRLHVYEGKPGSGRTPRSGVAIGQRPMRDLARRPSLIQTWITAMPLKESSASQVVKDVVAVFRAAVDDGVVNRNPLLAESVERPVQGRSKARPWPREHLDAMEEELPGPLKVFPKLGAGTGGRQGELFGLGKEDIQFLGRDPRVHFVRQVKKVGSDMYFAPLKNQKEHSPPLARLLAERLARHMAENPPAAVTLEWYDPSDRELHGTPVTVELVLHDDGKVWTRDTFGGRWRRARQRAGIEKRPARGEKRKSSRRDGAHVLRHMAASAWLRSGIDVVRVAAWLGDTPEIVLSTYAHLMPERDDDDGREAINEMLSEDTVAQNMPCEASKAELSQVDGLLT